MKDSLLLAGFPSKALGERFGDQNDEDLMNLRQSLSISTIYSEVYLLANQLIFDEI
jgi:hypothetical protein